MTGQEIAARAPLQELNECPLKDCKKSRHAETHDEMADVDVYEARDFETAVHEITGGGRWYFLEQQLYYFFCARHASPLRNFMGRFTGQRPGRPRREIFEKAFRDYVANTSVPFLIQPKSEFEIRGRSEGDIRDYAFDFLIVTEREDFARLLLMNRFHFHHRAAVVAMDGFPGPLFEHFMETAREFQDVSIICLHDASPAGLSLPGFVRSIAPERPILDAGLRPRDFLSKPSRLFTARADELPGDAGTIAGEAEYQADLSSRETNFLRRGLRIELANLGPRDLMTLLARYLRRRKRERSVFFAEEVDT